MSYHRCAFLPSKRQVIERLAPTLERTLRARGLRYGAPIFLRLFKESKELEMWVQGGTRFHLFRTYTICDHSGDLGPKQQAGDLQSPEGFYRVTPGRMNPESHYHLAAPGKFEAKKCCSKKRISTRGYVTYC